MSGIIAQNVGRHGGLIKAPSGGGGAWTLIQTLTSDGSDSNLSFTSGIDSTYDEYCFKFINIHPETDNVYFQVNFRDGGSLYDATKTTTFFRAWHHEDDASAGMGYEAGEDLAEGTGTQKLTVELGADNDQCVSGILHLFNPSNTTFVKHFSSAVSTIGYNDVCFSHTVAGYCNVTAAIDGVQFDMSSGEIQGGSISLYGIG